jgi:drug/metabolite transporter (DMT)-like permease
MRLFPPSLKLGAMKLSPSTVGILAAFGAALAYGSGQVVARQVVTNVASPLVTSFFALLFGSLVLAVVVRRDVPQDMKAPRRTFLYVTLAGLASSTAVVLMFTALSLAPVVVVSPVASLTPLFALVFTHLFLQRLERVTLRIVVGTLLVVAGIVLVVVGSARG